MMFPLVRELAGDGIPVTVTCRVLKLCRPQYYRWLDEPITDAERCTTATRGRVIVLHPHHGLLAAARAFAATDAFTEPYKQHRPMVDRSIAWLVRGSRRLRYRGIERNRLWLGHRVAAVNLNRLINLGLIHGPDGWAIA
jgi:hypothetical protein